ncbi:site-specific DNA-methyltransferase [Dethiobacter alkaliphilus]|uniref:site-specific DNA-methyltransferase n=1 Tax=Dethiobacter alkaliphilus TaxID=427926 RepID=UPI0022277BF7|nr:site-specific DNA-methyltransferase [Dethiobacter alkaliphilus]MCW3491019.1 site-specific DNA-methyltransferase [Dethiobacter alkaliphilus]
MTKTISPPGPRVREGELWTAKQRQMHSLHYVISYRASFKPELPDYCIRKFSKAGDVVADPFCGRGTTALQANLLGRPAWVNDANPLAICITRAKCSPVSLPKIERFLGDINWQKKIDLQPDSDLLAFYHPETLRELYILKDAISREESETSRFVQLLALSRLHGHSTGFFSAYSMPQLSVLPEAQRRINQKRGEEPPYRPVAPRIITKARRALKDNCLQAIRQSGAQNRYLQSDARNLSPWPDNSVDLVVTSPPFLNCVNYLHDNWLEHWFLNINPSDLKGRITQTASIRDWKSFVAHVLLEIGRILRVGGICVFEVGEVHCGGEKINLDEAVTQVIAENRCGLQLMEVLIQKQQFTKLAHCFAVTNNKKGTNTQRLLVLEKSLSL